MRELIVVGGGAAGFFCAINAARLCPEMKVTILEKSTKVLSKVKVSGGGRCNVTHNCTNVEELVTKYPRGRNFLKKELYQFTPQHTLEWFSARGVPLKTEADGRMFPATNSSATIIDCLLEEASKYKVDVIMNTGVKDISKNNGRYIIQTKERTFSSIYLCIACGGFPKIEQFEWLQSLKHTIHTPVPSLFTFNIPENSLISLMGVSVPEAQVKIAGTKLSEKGALLITHWGLSGPVILRLSAWGARTLSDKNYHFTAQVNWVPDYNENTLLEEWPRLSSNLSAQKLEGKNPFQLPARLWKMLLEKAGVNAGATWATLLAKQRNKLFQILTNDTYEVRGKTTFKEEFVTCGGVELSEIDPKTLESREHENLFFAGEIMNVDGITGGFNFQHAWASGYIAAKSIASKSNETIA